MTTNKELHAVLIAHGYFAQDVSDTGWELYDKEEGPGGDEWIQTMDGGWQHRKDPMQLGAGRVVAQGLGAQSLDDYLRIKCK